MSGFRSSLMPLPQRNERPATPVSKVRRPAPGVPQIVEQHLYTKDEEDNWPQAAREIDRTGDALMNLPSKIRAQVIVLQAARRHRIDPSLIFSPRRGKSIVAARFEAVAEVAKACPLWSLPRIGAFFNRDHTTILYAIRKMGVVRG